MEIIDSTFENNQWTESCIFISSAENTNLFPCYTRIAETTFKEISGTVISLDERESPVHLELYSNKFTHNLGRAILSKHGSVIDNASTYIHNQNESDSNITILRGSTYTGTEITFDYNEVNNDGGAIYVSGASIFVCDSCEFTNNKAIKGGAIYVEGDSRTEISSSTFDNNIATENGSAYYLISSKTDPKSSI